MSLRRSWASRPLNNRKEIMNQVSTAQPQAQAPAPQLNMATMPADVKKKMEILQAQVHTLEMCRQLGHHYAQTEMVPKQYRGKPEDAAVAIQWGMEIGLQPLQALQNVAVVNGNATLWGDALVALVKQSGLCEYLSTEWDEQTLTATVRTKRKGEPTEEVRSYSMADAQQAGLASRQTYQQHGRRMIQARARSHVLRDVYADLLKGFQIREILEEEKEVYGEDFKGKPKEMGAARVVQPEHYPDADFEANFPKWEKAILAGKKTPQDIIKMVQSKAPLTEEQKQTIENVGAEQ